ncbi:MAG: acetolactate synthase small subunit [Clostridia bacterium]|nr:acetolactate synthase small subunit [Clostridia bacterium]MBO7249657.1 acetolactate synthase small subunit [Clostridia bacterium]
MKKQCMVLLVENNSGVLARVSSLFMQRGFNIDSLTVSSTEIPHISRITVMTTGDSRTFSQIMKQTSKLVEAKMIFSVEPEFSLIREILMVKFSSATDELDTLKKIIADFGANIIDMSHGCFVAELTESPQKVDDFLDAVKDFEMIEMCRSGAIALERGLIDYEL